MPIHQQDSLTQHELGQKMLAGQFIKSHVTFENHKTAEIEVESLGNKVIKTSTLPPLGLISFSDSMPLWGFAPQNIDSTRIPTYTWHGQISNALTAAGSSLGFTELSNIRTTVRFNSKGYFSPKVYPSGWGGGSRARIKTYKITHIAKNVGRKVFIIGVVTDAAGVVTGQISALKGITNIGFSALATFGGPIGLTIGIVYWGLDLLGAFYSPTLAPNIRKDPYIQPVDNLRVVLPIHPFPPTIIKRRFSPRQTFIGPASKSRR